MGFDVIRSGASVQQRPYTAGAVALACGVPSSSRGLRQAITQVTLSNVRVDLRHALDGSYHFDDEMFEPGKRIITNGITAVQASNQQGNYEAARHKLGTNFHPLQVCHRSLEG